MTYSEAVASFTQTPVDMVATQGLAMVSAAVNGKGKVQVRPGYQEPLNVYMVTVGKPGDRKTPVQRLLTEPIRAREELLMQEHLTKSRRLAAERKIKSQALRNRQKSPECNDVDDEELVTATMALDDLTPPSPPALMTTDATPEALAALQQANGGRMAILSDEGGFIATGSGKRYSKDASLNLDLLLQGWDGGHVRHDRLTRDPVVLRNPSLVIGAMVQPAIAADMFDTPWFRERGLVGRFLFSWPHSHMGARISDPPVIPERLTDAYRSAMERLLDLPHGQGEPPLIVLSEGAVTAWRQFHDEVEVQLSDHGAMAHMTEWGGKITGQVVRLAGLLHVAAWAWGGSDHWLAPISRREMEAAIALARYFTEHAKIIYEEMMAISREAAARKILKWVVRNKRSRFTESDYIAHHRYRTASRQFDMGVECLIESGHLREVPHRYRGRGRRPRGRCFEVNPLWLAKNA